MLIVPSRVRLFVSESKTQPHKLPDRTNGLIHRTEVSPQTISTETSGPCGGNSQISSVSWAGADTVIGQDRKTADGPRREGLCVF